MKRKRISGLMFFLICIVINFFIVALQDEREYKYEPVPGFYKLHKNLYVRHCTTLNNALIHKRRLQQQLFEKCNVSLIFTLDRQNEYSYHYLGRKTRSKNSLKCPFRCPLLIFSERIIAIIDIFANTYSFEFYFR